MNKENIYKLLHSSNHEDNLLAIEYLWRECDTKFISKLVTKLVNFNISASKYLLFVSVRGQTGYYTIKYEYIQNLEGLKHTINEV